MLFDGPEHGTVLADDLRRGGNAGTIKAVIGFSKPAFAGKHIELVLPPDIKLVSSQGRRDRFNDIPLLRIFRQEEEPAVSIVKGWAAVLPLCSGDFYRQNHGAVLELVYIAVIGTVHPAEGINGICKDGNSHR